MTNEQAKTDLLPHSEAKVKLYGRYLAIYLNILSRVPAIRRVFLFDLLCGEGKYANEGEGSPLVALEVIKNHYFANGKTCPDIEVWFNDNGDSKIEPGIAKIERVRKLSGEVFVPENVELRFFQEDYSLILTQALATINHTYYSKGLFFIDPYGYKDTRPSHIKQILDNGNSEALLFLPISFMYRFWNKAAKTSFAGSDPLESFARELYEGTTIPLFNSAYEMIDGLQERFRSYLSSKGAFVTTFTIERDAANVFCLFFFTCNIRGLEKMLEAKWKMDSVRGKGYRANQQPMLWLEAVIQGYPTKLQEYLASEPLKSNQQVYQFGLEQGFLPKHTNDNLREWQREGILKVISPDGSTVRKNAFYLSRRDRVVVFELVDQ